MKWLTSGLLVLMFVSSTVVKADDKRLLNALASDNHFALMRHALAPGNGDPSNFNVDDCSTQRNLDVTGRQQAKNIGKFLTSPILASLKVYSSQWCRCMETAQLLNIGPVNALPELNSFYADMSRATVQTEAIRNWLASSTLPVLLVTHQVNITALSGVYPSSGEIVIMKRDKNGDLNVVGSIEM